MMRRILSFLFSVALAMAMVPAAAFATEPLPNVIAAEKWGTCPWELTDDGVLTVHPGKGMSNSVGVPVPAWETHRDRITKIVFQEEDGKKVIAPRQLQYLLARMCNVVEVDCSGLDTSDTEDMDGLFEDCTALTTVNLSGLDTSSVKSMSFMFSGCDSLRSITLGEGITVFHMPGDRWLSTRDGRWYSTEVIDATRLGIADTYTDYRTFLDDVTIDYGPRAYPFSGKTRRPELMLTDKKTGYGLVEGKDYEVSLVGDTVNAGIVEVTINGTGNYKGSARGSYEIAHALLCSASLDVTSFVYDGTSKRPNVLTVEYDSGGVPMPASWDSFDIVYEENPYGVGTHYVTITGEGNLLGTLSVAYEIVEPSGQQPDPDPDSGSDPDPDSNPGTDPDPDPDRNPNADRNPGPILLPDSNPDFNFDKPMFRLYNPNSGEHFYTASTVERDAVIGAGWNDEGTGWVAPSEGEPVYRLYNPYAGEHHYTLDADERDMLVAIGWNDEGVGWYSGGSLPLYRLYNPNEYANNHHYSTSTEERDHLLGLGWQDEGIAWYGIG